MGLFSSKQSQTTPTADTNGDGIITRRELEAFEKRMMDTFQEQKQREIVDYQLQIRELEKQVESLKHLNRTLETQKPQPLGENNQNSIVRRNSKLTELSRKRVDEFVDKLLADDDVNIKYLPDFVERKIYQNVFNLLVNILDNIVESTTINIMGHQLTLDVVPEEDPLEMV